jgi:hypothetical protein
MIDKTSENSEFLGLALVSLMHMGHAPQTTTVATLRHVAQQAAQITLVAERVGAVWQGVHAMSGYCSESPCEQWAYATGCEATVTHEHSLARTTMEGLWPEGMCSRERFSIVTP